MPRAKTSFYKFSGFVTQDMYSEEEMAEAIGLSVAQLRAALDPELFGPSPHPERTVYSYHAHPWATQGEFAFNRASYQHNLVAHNFVEWMKREGLWTEPEEACAAFLRAQDHEKLPTMDEGDFRAQLQRFLAAWTAKDETYHRAIKGHYQHIRNLARIWQASGYLNGMWVVMNHNGIIFFGVDEPPQGTFIPWRYLALRQDLGFYDQREFPDSKPEFIRKPKPEDWQPLNDKVRLRPGHLILGERWVYDDYQEFMGMVIAPEGDEITFTPNGRHLMEVQRRDIHSCWVSAATQ